MAFENPFHEDPLDEGEHREAREGEQRFSGDHWVLESRIEEAARAGEAIKRTLQEAGWTDEEVGIFGISVDEAVANAVIHGNWGIEKQEYPSDDAYHRAIEERGRQNPGDKHVTIDIALSDHDVEVTVRDEGSRVFDPDALPDPTHPENILKTHGRGAKIIQACDFVDFSIPGQITLRKRKRTGDELE